LLNDLPIHCPNTYLYSSPKHRHNMATQLTVLEMPISICRNHISEQPTTLRMKQHSSARSSGGYTITDAQGDSTLYTSDKKFSSWNSNRSVYDSNGVRLIRSGLRLKIQDDQTTRPTGRSRGWIVSSIGRGIYLHSLFRWQRCDAFGPRQVHCPPRRQVRYQQRYLHVL
jgi:hypothetical protein